MSITLPVIVGSRSPRRLELLRTIVPETQLTVCPPRESAEAGFDGLTTLDEIEQRVREIVVAKRDDVIAQLCDSSRNQNLQFTQSGHNESEVIVVAADTAVVVRVGEEGDKWMTLGQPPTDDSWREVVRGWFRDHLAGRTHVVMSGVSVSRISLRQPASAIRSVGRVCCTRVTMRSNIDEWLEWYLETGESVGKAGGYAIQGAGSVFVTRIEGSLTNIIGLPLEETVALFRELGLFTDTSVAGFDRQN